MNCHLNRNGRKRESCTIPITTYENTHNLKFCINAQVYLNVILSNTRIFYINLIVIMILILQSVSLVDCSERNVKPLNMHKTNFLCINYFAKYQIDHRFMKTVQKFTICTYIILYYIFPLKIL